MLADIVHVLEKLGLTSGKPNLVYMNIRWSHHISLYVDTGVEKRYFIKTAPTARSEPLQNEAKALRTVGVFLVGRVPALLGFTTHNGFSFLVLSSLEGDPILGFADIAGSAARRDACVDLFRDLHSQTHAPEKTEIDEQLAFFEREVPVLAKYASSLTIGTVLEKLPHINQHGDLVANNVGYKGNSPIVYDWEDYGRVGLPGFDAAMLVGSLLKHDPARLLEVLYGEGRENGAVRALAEASGVAFDDFRRFIPVYYGCFLWLKKTNGYGEPVQRRALNAITGVINGQVLASSGSAAFA